MKKSKSYGALPLALFAIAAVLIFALVTVTSSGLAMLMMWGMGL